MKLKHAGRIIAGFAALVCLVTQGCRPYTPPPGSGGRPAEIQRSAQTEPGKVSSSTARSNQSRSNTRPGKRALPVPNPYLRTNTVNVASRRRQEIVHKLKSITFDEIQFDEIPLGEVIRYLKEETAKRDPGKKGLNFMVFSPAAKDGVNVRRNPNPGSTDQGVVVEQTLDIENVVIDIDPPLRDLPLLHVLDAIMKKADAPIQFAVTDYAVVVWQKTPGESDRISRTFRGSPGNFQQGLEGVIGIPANGVGLAQ